MAKMDNLGVLLSLKCYYPYALSILGCVIAQFVARSKGYKVEGQIGVTGTYPTQCHLDG